MQKIEIIALLSDRKRIMERLQRRGLVELSDCADEQLVKMNSSASIAQFEKSKSSAQQALEILEEALAVKHSMFDSLKGKAEYEVHDFGRQASLLEETMKKVYDIIACSKRIAEHKSQIGKLTVAIDSLQYWQDLDIRSDFKGTAYTRCYIGTMPGGLSKEELQGMLPEDAELYVVAALKEKNNIAVLCHRDSAEEAYDRLREAGFAPLSDTAGGTPREKSKKYQEEIETLQGKIAEREKQIRDYEKALEEIRFIVDYLQIRIDKYEALKNVGMSENTFVLTGYIPQRYADKLIKELEGRFTIAISLSEPEEDEEVPVLLENSRFSAPVEGITEMYALPTKRDLDPTPIMSFFYYLFFGMMLSDAGYGVVMVIVTAIILHKGRMTAKLRKTMKMFQYCGISTIIWGALFGSWYGDLPQIIARDYFNTTITNIHGVEGSTALWFQPLDDPMALLLFSFILGILHLLLGLCANFYKLWKEGNKWDAIWDVIPVMLTVLGAAPLAGGILTPIPAIASQIGTYMAIAGIVLLVLTSSRSSKNIVMRLLGGLYGLYNVATGYLSDILSYSRLLALGLATGSIASVMNLIGSMPGPGNLVVETIMLLIMIAVGHTANIGVNLLGAYVHTDRLQFVELFSKFYEGGGRAFEPLRVNTKYVTFKEEK